MKEETEIQETIASPQNSIENNFHETNKTSWGKTWLLKICFVFGLIVLLSICVTLFLTVGRHDTQASTNEHSSKRGTSSPKIVTKYRSSSPSSSPTKIHTIEDQIEDVIRSAAWWWSGSEWKDPNSYNSKAIRWLKADVGKGFTVEQYKKDDMDSLHSLWKTRYALACVYYSTYAVQHVYTHLDIGFGIIHAWNNDTNWLSHETSECEWFGITCEKGGKPSRRLGQSSSGDDRSDTDTHSVVTKLELPNNKLTGSLPREVTLLSNIKTLDLYHNWIWNSGGEGNSWLGSMTSLEYLYYGSTFFDYDQGIPTEISKLKHLKEYDCSYTLYRGSLHGDSFRGLESLTYLSMSGNSFDSSLPSELARLSQLQRLYVQDAALKGSLTDFVEAMASSSSTSQLVELWLDDNHLTGTIPTELGALTNLASLSVSNNALTGTIPTTLANLRNMEQWWWYDNKLTGTIPGGNWTSLRLWHLDGNEFSYIPTDICKLRTNNGGMLEELVTECNDDPIVRCDCCEYCMV